MLIFKYFKKSLREGKKRVKVAQKSGREGDWIGSGGGAVLMIKGIKCYPGKA